MKRLDDKRTRDRLKASTARGRSSSRFSRAILGTIVLSWWLIEAILLLSCYGMGALGAGILPAVPLVSTAVVSFLLGRMRSASFTVSIDSAEVDRLHQMGEPHTTHEVTLGITMGEAPVEVDARASEEHGVERRCDAMRVRYGLSERETEVLLMLVRGRDALYISDSLCISQHTVKCHIYHIYQKAGIHSRQELIDLFEANLLAG